MRSSPEAPRRLTLARLLHSAIRRFHVPIRFHSRAVTFIVIRFDLGHTDRLQPLRPPASASEPEISAFWINLVAARKSLRARRQRTSLQRLNQLLGNPIWYPRLAVRSIREAAAGLRLFGKAQRARGIPTYRQALILFVEHFRYGTLHWEASLYRLLDKDCRKRRRRQFPHFSHIHPMLYWLDENAKDFAILDNKARLSEALRKAGIPSIAIIAEFANGDMIPASPELPEADLFAKPVNESCGIGAAMWEFSDGAYRNVSTGKTFAGSQLLEHLRSQQYPMLLQRRLKVHSDLVGITNESLATVRLVSCKRPDGEIDFIAPVIRLPIGNSVIDNYSRGGYSAPINLETGTICAPAIQKNKRCEIVRGLAFHPDTKQLLEGTRIPFWRELLALGRRAHLTFSSVHFVGWDIAVLETGPVILEANLPMDLDINLVTHDIELPDTQFISYYNHWVAKHHRLRALS